MVEGLQITFEKSPTPQVFRLGYVNMEKVLYYYFFKIFLKNVSESKTSQLCLDTLI